MTVSALVKGYLDFIPDVITNLLCHLNLSVPPFLICLHDWAAAFSLPCKVLCLPECDTLLKGPIRMKGLFVFKFFGKKI